MFRLIGRTGVVRAVRGLTGEAAEKKWDLVSAVSLERRPVITRELNALERKMSDLLARAELEGSYKSDFEMRLEGDAKRKKEAKWETEVESGPQQTGQDYLDACQEELGRFVSGRREGREEGDLRSTDRALDRHLLLLVQEKTGRTPLWVLPQGPRMEGESMREAAQRVLAEKCGSGLRVRFFGKAPAGFYKYKYPRSLSPPSGAVGAKVFFFKAHLLDGRVDLRGGPCTDYNWATRKEMVKLPQDYARSVRLFLIDEHY